MSDLPDCQTSDIQMVVKYTLCTLHHIAPASLNHFPPFIQQKAPGSHTFKCLSTKRKTQRLNTLNKQITEILNATIQTNRSLLNREESIAYKHRGPLVSKSICSMLFCPLGDINRLIEKLLQTHLTWPSDQTKETHQTQVEVAPPTFHSSHPSGYLSLKTEPVKLKGKCHQKQMWSILKSICPMKTQLNFK